jgi:hypothetical protein
MKTIKRMFSPLLAANAFKGEEPQELTQSNLSPTGESSSAQELKDYFVGKMIRLNKSTMNSKLNSSK